MSEKLDGVAELAHAADDMAKAFDQTLPEQPTYTSIKPTRITYNTQAGTTQIIALARENKFHEAIFQGASATFQSDWFHGLTETSRRAYSDAIRRFIDWVNETGYESRDINRYDCLKAYEAYCMNQQGQKRSPLEFLTAVMNRALASPGLTDEDFGYLKTLLKVSKPSKGGDAKPYTLTDWFNLPWLRSVLGEQKYLQLESPSRLFLSFRVTIAETLLHLLDVRAEWQQHPITTFEEPACGKNWFRKWNYKILRRFGSFDSAGQPRDAWAELLWLDLVRPSDRGSIKTLLSQSGIESLASMPRVCGQRIRSWARSPTIYHPDYQHAYSPLEERLMAWLVACEAVQPTDIPKLKTTDYALEFNQSGRLIAMECCYYKGRASSTRQPAILMASDCWTKAQYRYLTGLPVSSPVFQFNVMSEKAMPDIREGFAQKGDISFLWRIWQLPRVQRRIDAALRRAGASSIFLDAALALTQGSEPVGIFAKIPGNNIGAYRESVARPLPQHIFSLTHVKTTAVHAGSDRYRDGDLINHHSHTSTTEKHAYLTDANKDFVNRAGRVTRLVLNDLQNVVYQPSVSAMAAAVNDLELSTRVVEATGSEDIRVHSLDQSIERVQNDDIILVPDTVEQALLFIHTIAEAEARLPQMLAVRPDWVERTLLIRVEWMTRNLARMRSASEAQKQYADLKPHLPNLFDYLLETVE